LFKVSNDNDSSVFRGDSLHVVPEACGSVFLCFKHDCVVFAAEFVVVVLFELRPPTLRLPLFYRALQVMLYSKWRLKP